MKNKSTLLLLIIISLLLAVPMVILQDRPWQALVGLDDTDSVSLLHFNGDNYSTTFEDESGKTWTANVSAKLSTISPVFGTASGGFEGTGWISTPDNNDFTFSDLDFSVDFWFMRASIGQQFIFGNTDAPGENTSMFGEFNNQDRFAFKIFSGSDSYDVTSADIITDTTNWHHVAVVRDGGSLNLYIDGELQGTSDVTGVVLNDVVSSFSIGRTGDYNSNFFDGNIDEFRISKVARWVDVFTPPIMEYAPTVPLSPTGIPPTPTTVVAPRETLLHYNGTDNSTTFADATGKVWTAYGNAKLSTDSPKFGTASGLFDGASWISAPDCEDFSFGSQDFTIDFWAKRSTIEQQFLFGNNDSAGDPSVATLYSEFNGDGNFQIWFFTGNESINLATIDAITDTNWHHIAVVRNGDSMSIYADGISQGLLNTAGLTFNDSASNFSIGRTGDFEGSPFIGAIDEFRISIGTARWTADFTPPTEEYVIISQSTPTPTPVPTDKPGPTSTLVPTDTPINTPEPTTPVFTNTPTPAVVSPTNTTIPTVAPTNTYAPVPTVTSRPIVYSTVTPIPTATINLTLTPSLLTTTITITPTHPLITNTIKPIISQLPVTGNTSTIRILDESGQPIVSTDVVLDSVKYVTDTKGNITVNVLKAGQHEISIVKGDQTYRQSFVLGVEDLNRPVEITFGNNAIPDYIYATGFILLGGFALGGLYIYKIRHQ